MNTYLIISIITGIAVFAILIAMIVVRRNRGEKIEPDYRVFFILGISWLPIGIATDNPGLWGMGAVFMAVGLANRSKWKGEPKWSELDPEKRRAKILIIVGLTVLLALGVGAYILTK